MAQVRRYIARVHDLEGNHPVHGAAWFRVSTIENPKGEYGTRDRAHDVLERAIASYRHGRLSGHTDDVIVSIEPGLGDVRINDWVRGDVVAIADVPAKYRDDYRDTLNRVALAAYRSGSPVWLSDSFRTRAQQAARYQAWLNGGPLAAWPGTSDHEFGLSVDIPGARGNKVLINELDRLQMIDNVPSEGWHITNMARKR